MFVQYPRIENRNGHQKVTVRIGECLAASAPVRDATISRTSHTASSHLIFFWKRLFYGALMEYLKIRNWDKWQNYRKDRGRPPWIKIQLALLQDIDFLKLTNSQRGELLTLWIIAAERQGRIPSDPADLQLLGRMDGLPDLEFYINKGFLVDDIHMTTSCQPHDNQLPTVCHPLDVTDTDADAEAEAEAEADTEKDLVRFHQKKVSTKSSSMSGYPETENKSSLMDEIFSEGS